MKPKDVMLQTVTRPATYIILAFSVYLFIGGHNNPGGGFVGGLMVASAVSLLLLVYDIKMVRAGFPFDFMTLAAAGVLVTVLTSSGPIIFGKPFLSHAFGYFDIPLFGPTELATAVLFDMGVALAVFGTAMAIIYAISEDTCQWKQ